MDVDKLIEEAKAGKELSSDELKAVTDALASGFKNVKSPEENPDTPDPKSMEELKKLAQETIKKLDEIKKPSDGPKLDK